MERKFLKLAGAALLASSITTMGPAMAQTSQSESAQSESRSASDESDRDWGWLGLLGLLGLAGMRRRRDRDLHRDATSATRSGVYNR